MESLGGKTALVTGAGSLTGRQIAAGLAAAGAQLAVNDINPDRLEETVRLIDAAGGSALPVLADVSKKFAVQAMFNEIEDALGRPNILVNNARVCPKKELLAMDEWDWRRTLDVNLTGLFVMMQVAGRLMRAQGGGMIVNVIQPPPEEDRRAAYLAAAGGIRELTRAAAQELGPLGIRVFGVEGAGAAQVLALFSEIDPG